MGDAALPPATVDNIIRPVFDGRIKILFLNPFPNKPWILHVCSTCLLKTLWEKEKLLVTSNFSFSHSVFYPLREVSAIFIKLIIVVCLEESKIRHRVNPFLNDKVFDLSKLIGWLY